MPSLAEFNKLLKEKPDDAMKEYVIHVDQSLDGSVGANGVLVNKVFAQQDVVFEYVAPNIIKMRAKGGGDATFKLVWYLPWVSRDVSKAALDENGPSYFSTSQLNGCRFTIQYADSSKQKVTVLHVAGDFDFKDGSSKREELETKAIGAVGDAKLRRRYSIGQSKMAGSTKARGSLQHKILGDETRLYYGGNKASIFGYRDSKLAWHFWAQEMDEQFGRADRGMGRKNLD